MSGWRATDQDRDLFRRELDGFVPDRIFDSHVHLYNVDYFPQDDIPPALADGPRVVDAGVYLDYMADLLPGRAYRRTGLPVSARETADGGGEPVRGRGGGEASVLARPDDGRAR